VCECGGRGHLGAVSSGRAVLEYARTRAPEKVRNEGLTSGDLVAAFRRGEPWAVEIIEHRAGPLGWALAAMHLGLGIERFVLIGRLCSCSRRRLPAARPSRPAGCGFPLLVAGRKIG